MICIICKNKADFSITLTLDLEWKDENREDVEICEACFYDYIQDKISKILIVRRLR